MRVDKGNNCGHVLTGENCKEQEILANPRSLYPMRRGPFILMTSKTAYVCVWELLALLMLLFNNGNNAWNGSATKHTIIATSRITACVLSAFY